MVHPLRVILGAELGGPTACGLALKRCGHLPHLLTLKGPCSHLSWEDQLRAVLRLVSLKGHSQAVSMWQWPMATTWKEGRGVGGWVVKYAVL